MANDARRLSSPRIWPMLLKYSAMWRWPARSSSMASRDHDPILSTNFRKQRAPSDRSCYAFLSASLNTVVLDQGVHREKIHHVEWSGVVLQFPGAGGKGKGPGVAFKVCRGQWQYLRRRGW